MGRPFIAIEKLDRVYKPKDVTSEIIMNTAPHKYRDRPRDSASLGGSPGYQRYQKISRMLRQVCESQFFSA
jgi:hypothetical protein